MANFDLIRSVVQKTDSKIVLMVMDGLGGLPHAESGRSELETAAHPNMDRLARQSLCGLSLPVAHGITPGSGPGHLALFGYDPVAYQIGRGILEAMGLDMDVQEGDVAARGNYCTVDAEGRIIDRRAGRLSTAANRVLTGQLGRLSLTGGQAVAAAGREHRFAVVFRPSASGKGLSDAVSDTDPQREGVAPRELKATAPDGERTAKLVRSFLKQAQEVLKESSPANGLVLRGFAKLPDLPKMQDVYSLSPVAVAAYPMYRGLAKLVGMEVVQTGDTVEEEIDTVKKHWDDHDFFFLHVKATDTAGEDGDFARKVQALERIDRALPALLDLQPDVLIVTGDHSTPAVLHGHSWHPVPLIVHSKWMPRGYAQAFTERECAMGGLGIIPAAEVMSLALANALKLEKYGA